MRKLLAALFGKTPPKPAAPGLNIAAAAGGMTVTVQQYTVTAGSSAEDAIETGLTRVADKLAALCQAELQKQSQVPTGLLAYTFRLEPDGMIRMVVEGEQALTGGDFTAINLQFIGAAMSRQVVFPAVGQPTVVEVQLKLEQP